VDQAADIAAVAAAVKTTAGKRPRQINLKG
jgi:hypothetical protein